MEQFIADIDAFCKRHDLKASAFGQQALNDKAFVFQVKTGRRVWPETEQRVRQFMAAYQGRRAAA